MPPVFKSYRDLRQVWVLCAFFIVVMWQVSLIGCSRAPENSSGTWELQGLITDDLATENILQTVADHAVVIIVNNATARSTILKDGVVIDQWNSAVADITGLWHKVGGVPKSQHTPPGIYSVDDLEYCPVWYPATIIDRVVLDTSPSSETVVSQHEAPEIVVEQIVSPDDKRYWEIIDERPEKYGGCGYSNPLGHHILWFQGPYGFHGTTANAEYILDFPTADERRVSGGCIRNPIEKIKQLFEGLITLFKLENLRQKVGANQVKVQQQNSAGPSLDPENRPKTVTANMRGRDDFKVRVIVGSFKRDLPFDSAKRVNNTTKLHITNASCLIEHDNVPIYDARIFRDVVGYYRKGDVIETYNYHEGGRSPVQTERGWILRYYARQCDFSYGWTKHTLPSLPYTTLRERLISF